jgi:hypothetical protein
MNAQTQRSALYNPATLDRIRSGANAADLGWEQSTYEVICRRHQLPLSAPRKSQAVKAPEPAPVVVIEKPAAVKPPVDDFTVMEKLLTEHWNYSERRDIVFEYRGAVKPIRFKRRGAKHAIKLFLMLSESYGERITSRQYAEATNSALPSVSVKVSNASRSLCNILLKTPYDIDVGYRTGGGYMLVYAGTKDPARVKIISVGDVKLEGGETE